MKLRKITTVLITAVFILTACASAGAAGSYADPVPVKMERALNEKYMIPEVPMYMTSDVNSGKGSWATVSRFGYTAYDTGEHFDCILEVKGVTPFGVEGLPPIVFGPDSYIDLLSINGVPVQIAIPDSSGISQKQSKLPDSGKRMVSVCAGRTAVALYESDKVRAEHLKARPYMKDDQLMVPLRGVVDYLGAEIGWDNATKTVTLTQGERKIKLSATDMEIKDGSTMVPASFLSEQLGFTIKWLRATDGNNLRADIYN